MSKPWNLQDARANFSKVVKNALKGRPQRITRNGQPAVVVLSEQEYQRLNAAKDSLVAFFRTSPLAEAVAAGEVVIERDNAPIRDVAL